MGELLGIKEDMDTLFLSRSQTDPGEGCQLEHRPHHTGAYVSEIDLRDLLSRYAAGVFNPEANLQRLAAIYLLRKFETAVCKGCVAQPVAKG